MKSSSLKKETRGTHLKVIKSSSKQEKEVNCSKIYINTLNPNFNYTNHKGEIITPNNCILL